ncbi:putative jacalin-like lectin domain-containing protein [Helianthus anomalus]
MANNYVEVGPWGGSGGANPWSIIPNGGRITRINVRSGAIVDAIYFGYTEGGTNYETAIFGGRNGLLSTIDIADDEEIIEINGKVGTFENLNLVTQLTFVTNKQTYGPYGTNGGTDFSCPIAKGKVVGFFGRYGAYLDAIGVVLSP